MKLRLHKSDKADAQMIAQFGKEQKPPLWQAPSEYIIKCQQLETVLDLYTRQYTALKNKIHNLLSAGNYSKLCQNNSGCNLNVLKLR